MNEHENFGQLIKHLSVKQKKVKKILEQKLHIEECKFNNRGWNSSQQVYSSEDSDGTAVHIYRTREGKKR